MAKDARPTQVDVARLAGVSRQTVSLVVLDDPRVSARSRAAVRQAMADLRYRPNAAARSLATSRTGLLGVMMPDFANPFYAELADALDRASNARGVVPVISSLGEGSRTEESVVDRFVELRVDALVLVSPLLDNGRLAALGAHVPTVLLTRNCGPAEVDVVGADDRRGSRLATDHLLKRGYRPVVYVGYDRGVPGDSAGARLLGYREAVAEAGGVARYVPVEADYRQAAAAVLADAQAGLGIVAHNDALALTVAGLAIERGLVLGRDVGVCGFDDTLLARFPGVALTSVGLQAERLAGAAIDLALERVAGRTTRREVILPPRLVARSSTDPHRA